MPKAGIKEYSKQTTSPQWFHHYTHGVLPGGNYLEPAGITPQSDGRIYLASGTLLGRTYAERDAAVGFGIADPVNDEQFGLLMHDVWDAREDDEIELYTPKMGLVVWENFLPNLPDGSPLAETAELDLIRQLYNCMMASSRESQLMSSRIAD